MSATYRTTAFSTSLIFSLFSMGQVADLPDRPATEHFGLHYFKCLNPKDPACVSTSEAKKSADCPNCAAWQEVSANEWLAVVLPGIKRDLARTEGNKQQEFLANMAELTYTGSPLRDAKGQAIDIQRVISVSGKMGWENPSDTTDLSGSIVTWKDGTGFVLQGNAACQDMLIYDEKLGLTRAYCTSRMELDGFKAFDPAAFSKPDNEARPAHQR